MKFALLSVSYGGLFYKGPALPLEQQILKAKEFGFDALAIETKRPIASPLDLTKADRARIKDMAAGEGIALCAIESMSNFSGRHMEERENNLAMMRNVLELAVDLGIDMVKVFAAWPGIINDEEEISLYAQFERGLYYKRLYPDALRRWNHAVKGIQEVAAWAADMGLTLALQNHAPVITPGYEDCLTMMQEIDRPNVKMCLDATLFYERQSEDYIKESVKKCGKNIIHTHYGAWNFSETEDGIIVQDPSPICGVPVNYSTFIEELQKVGYEGYLTSEYCLPVVKNHQLGGMEEVDYATKISLQYMRQLVNDITAARTGQPVH